ncbi:LysR family transcriptional regulator [Paenibacillus pini]|uniref:LysR family transcriptional regulator YeiE n=1 Tax=Paenibacillus pini JCM 16418 TaxID=1236976 RepID=W7YM01_9BACL|nr:LysR family transcriptional regulator [Paenibacillus pini]GAF08578.1 LysR family transcriptional regulator YeiE [Paenibacillus pini JCM 16418]
MITETLKVFVTVAQQRNFSKAAVLLNLSQPGVSLHIRNLEQEFGAKLMHRTSKLVKLTEAGEILFAQAQQMLGLYEEAKQRIHLLRDEVTGSLHIGASFTIGEYIMPWVLAEYAQQYPHVEVQVHISNTNTIVQAVRAGRFELGLVEGIVDAKDVQISPFMKDEMVLIAPPEHPLTMLKTADIKHLQHQIWVMRESGSGTRAYSDKLIEHGDLSVKRSYVFNSSQGVKEAVAAGLGIALLSRLVIRKELDSGELCEIPIKTMKLSRELSIVQDKNQPQIMAVQKFMQSLDRHTRTL